MHFSSHTEHRVYCPAPITVIGGNLMVAIMPNSQFQTPLESERHSNPDILARCNQFRSSCGADQTLGTFTLAGCGAFGYSIPLPQNEPYMDHTWGSYRLLLIHYSIYNGITLSTTWLLLTETASLTSRCRLKRKAYKVYTPWPHRQATTRPQIFGVTFAQRAQRI
jgi:hypothetical protein